MPAVQGAAPWVPWGVASNSNSYRAGIIGLGMIGGADEVSAQAIGQSVAGMDGTHFHALRDTERVQLVAGSSRDAGRRERFEARAHGAAVYADYREMLQNERLDIVSVASYAPVHAEHSVAAVAAGARVVFCEKPLATSVAGAQQVVAACDSRRALLVVNHQRRFDPTFIRLRDHISAGGLGELTSGLLQWGSGRLVSSGTHTVDAIRMLSGREVEAVSGQLDLSGRPDCRGPDLRDPGGWGMLRMTGGLIVLVDAADWGAVPLQIALNGTKGRASIGSDGAYLTAADGASAHWVTDPGRSSMHRAVEQMVRWLDDGTPPTAPGDDAAATLEAVIALHVSHDRNAAWVELPLDAAERQREVVCG